MAKVRCKIISVPLLCWDIASQNLHRRRNVCDLTALNKVPQKHWKKNCNHQLNYMNMEERIAGSVTRVFKAVFPNTTNHYDTLFGGTAMLMMDEVAFITATRFSRMRMVTVSSDKIDFRKPIPHGTIIELIGQVTKVGKTSLQVRVDIYVEQMNSEAREMAVSGNFSLVAINEAKQPVSILTS